MTFKKDFNAIILHLLRGLVKGALDLELSSGSTANLPHIDVKVEELQTKVQELVKSSGYAEFLWFPDTTYIPCAAWFVSVLMLEIEFRTCRHSSMASLI